MPNRPFATIALCLTLAACTTGIRIFDSGFSATDIGDGRWTAKFDSTEAASKDEAQANFMVHSARWTIDHGGLYFQVLDLSVDGESKVAINQGAQAEADSKMTGDSKQSPVSGGQSAVTSGRIEKHHLARGTFRITRERPSDTDGPVYEASRVLDSYAGSRGSRPATSAKVGGGTR